MLEQAKNNLPNILSDVIKNYNVSVVYKSKVWKLLGDNLYNNFSTTIGNTIYLANSLADSEDITSLTGILVHELEHVQQYNKIPNYNIRYLLDKKFRWFIESICYKKQILFLKSKGYRMNKDSLVESLVTGYFGMCTRQQAEEFIQSLS